LLMQSTASNEQQSDLDTGELTRLNAEYERIEREMARTWEAYKAGIVGLDILSTERENSQKRLQAITQQRAEVQQRIDDAEFNELSDELAAKWQLEAIHMGHETSLEVRRQLLDRLQLRVTLEGDAIRVSGLITEQAFSYNAEPEPVLNYRLPNLQVSGDIEAIAAELAARDATHSQASQARQLSTHHLRVVAGGARGGGWGEERRAHYRDLCAGAGARGLRRAGAYHQPRQRRGQQAHQTRREVRHLRRRHPRRATA
jgi:hypothetical protein